MPQQVADLRALCGALKGKIGSGCFGRTQKIGPAQMICMQRGLLGTARPAFTCSRRTGYNVMIHNTLQRRAPPNTNLALLDKKHNTEQSTQIRISLLTSPAMKTWGSRVSKTYDLSVTDDVADTFGPPLVHTAKWHNICSCVSQHKERSTPNT